MILASKTNRKVDAMKTQQCETKLIPYMPYYGVGPALMLRLSVEKDAMVRKYCAMRQATEEAESYISCRVSKVLLRWDMRNLLPQQWDDETLRRQLWNACSNARLDFLRRLNARKRNGLAPQETRTAKILHVYYRGPRFFCGVMGGR